MSDKDVLFKFKLRYPWKKTLRGGDAITISLFLLAFFLSWYSFIYRSNPPKYDWFWFSFVSYVLILVGLDLAMRYILIHGDKIKAPIEVWVDEYEVHFRKGRAKMDFSMEGLKSVRVLLDDKMVMLETNYEKDEDWKKGWKVAFKRKNELELVDYKEFIEKTFLPFTEVVMRRLKELNPRIKVVKEDRRKKYR